MRVKLFVAAVAAGGLVALGAAIRAAIAGAGIGPAIDLVFFAGLIAATWCWPLILYRGSKSSEAHHLDEGLLVIMVLLLPPAAALIAFAIGTTVAQAARRRALVKSVFNLGQILVSVGAGVATVALLAPPAPHLSIPSLGAAALAAAVFFALNSAFLAAIAVITGGGSGIDAVLDGVEVRLILVGACLVLGLLVSLAASAYPWALAAAPIPFAILRQILAGHFRARHDRTRLTGLLNATVEAHASMGSDDAAAALTEAARDLLRSPVATISDVAPQPGELGAPMTIDGVTHWLLVSGRSKAEPFDSADQSLLEALVAVGEGALTNAALYQEGRFQRERLSAITSSLGEGVCAVNCDGEMTFLNPAAVEMLGLSSQSQPLAPEFIRLPALRAMETLETVRNDDTSFRRADGTGLAVAFTTSPIIDAGSAVGAVIAFRDITERKAFEEELARHAFHDALTGLPNRRLFIDHLDHALLRSERNSELHAVLFADIDRFKIINDGLGHHAGDQLLVAIAHRMRAALRPGDMLARFGGDEFTVLLEGVGGVGDAEATVERIIEHLREPIVVAEGHEVVATLSIGIALTPPGKTRDDVLHDADVAMYQAKARGRTGHYAIFDTAAMGARSAERLDIEAALRRAIENRELEVYYQPFFDIHDRTIVGAEALVRWPHPERGLLSPASFIGIAEETGLILPLGQFVMEEACRRARWWRDRYDADLTLSINLSPRQFQQPGLADDIEEILHATRVDPHQICLEITETMAMDDVDRSSAALERLKELGVRIAIDDFGTGYSSLGYLKRFPVDVVKIDRSFVDGLDTNPVDSAIAAAVIRLAEAVGMTTVAEGVETFPQLEHLRLLGCPVVQGYYLGQPVAPFVLERLLAEQVARRDGPGRRHRPHTRMRVAQGQ